MTICAYRALASAGPVDQVAAGLHQCDQEAEDWGEVAGLLFRSEPGLRHAAIMAWSPGPVHRKPGQAGQDATIKVIDSGTEELYFSVAEAQAADISRAVEAAREAFDSGPWPRLTHAERAGILRAIGAELARRSDDIGQIWPRQSGREGLLPFLETKTVI